MRPIIRRGGGGVVSGGLTLEDVCRLHRKRSRAGDSGSPVVLAIPELSRAPDRCTLGGRPLQVHIGTGLDTQIEYEGIGGLVYPSAGIPAEYFTLVAVGDRLHSRCHGWTDPDHDSPSTPQRLLGHGSPCSPWEIVTQVEIGRGELLLTQRDRYVQGDTRYLTTLRVENRSPGTTELQLYRAMDCQLPGHRPGYGRLLDEGRGGIAYSALPVDDPTASAMILAPIDPADYLLAPASELWDAVESRLPLPRRVVETIAGGGPFDGGLAIGWSLRLAPGEFKEVSHLTAFQAIVQGLASGDYCQPAG